MSESFECPNSRVIEWVLRESDKEKVQSTSVFVRAQVRFFRLQDLRECACVGVCGRVGWTRYQNCPDYKSKGTVKAET